MTKKFYFIAHCWLIVTLLLGLFALSGCIIADEGGRGHDDDHHDDRGPAPHGDGDRR